MTMKNCKLESTRPAFLLCSNKEQTHCDLNQSLAEAVTVWLHARWNQLQLGRGKTYTLQIAFQDNI